jgi:hypothetical protein
VVVNGFAVGAIAITYGPTAPASGRVDAALRDTTIQLSAHLRSYVAAAPEHEKLVPRTVSDPPPWG